MSLTHVNLPTGLFAQSPVGIRHERSFTLSPNEQASRGGEGAFRF